MACRKSPFRLEKYNLFWTGFLVFRERKPPMAEKKEMESAEEKVVEIETERLRVFENHPFKLRADSQILELQESVKKYGILNPLIVRQERMALMKSYQDTDENSLLRGLAIVKCW